MANYLEKHGSDQLMAISSANTQSLHRKQSELVKEHIVVRDLLQAGHLFHPKTNVGS